MKNSNRKIYVSAYDADKKTWIPPVYIPEGVNVFDVFRGHPQQENIELFKVGTWDEANGFRNGKRYLGNVKEYFDLIDRINNVTEGE